MDYGKQTVEKKQNKKKQIYADFNVLQKSTNFCFFFWAKKLTVLVIVYKLQF